MMNCEIGGINWAEMDRMKYWTFASSYKGDKKAEIRSMIFSGEYWGSLKRDGYWTGIYKNMDGEVAVLSRSRGVSGEYANHYEKVPHLHSFFDSLPNGTVLACELYLASNETSKSVTTILGSLVEKAIKRQEKEKLMLYVFDIWAWDGESYDTTAALTRFGKVAELKEQYENKYVEWAEYYNGEELWDKIQEYLCDGNEGVVITKADCPVYFKRTPARKTLKIKKEINNTIDCIFTGTASQPTKEYTGKELETWKYWENTLTDEKIQGDYYKSYMLGEPVTPVTKPYFNNWAGSLEIGLVKGKKVIPIGYLSGLTDEIKSNPTKYKGMPVEITCMEIFLDDNGKPSGLRHAKLVRLRPDLSITDCSWEKVFGDD